VAADPIVGRNGKLATLWASIVLIFHFFALVRPSAHSNRTIISHFSGFKQLTDSAEEKTWPEAVRILESDFRLTGYGWHLFSSGSRKWKRNWPTVELVTNRIRRAEVGGCHHLPLCFFLSENSLLFQDQSGSLSM